MNDTSNERPEQDRRGEAMDDAANRCEGKFAVFVSCKMQWKPK